MHTTQHRQSALAITTSTLLRDQLERCARDAGTEVHYASSIPEGRRLTRAAQMVIIGTDQTRRLRAPIACTNGPVIVVTLHTDDPQAHAHMQHIGAQLVIALSAAQPWPVEQLLAKSTAPPAFDRPPS